MARKDIRRYSLDELEAMRERRDHVTTRPDAPVVEPDEDFWRKAQVVMPDERPKTPVSLRLDADIVEFFKRQGRGYQTRINAVLRSFVEAHRQQPK